MASIDMHPSVGPLLRDWRRRRRLSQLDLALKAEASTRHISFVETGRARPGRQLLLRLAEALDVPAQQRNALLVAAGYAPVHQAASADSPHMEAARNAVDLLLRAHEPYPAVAVDGDENITIMNWSAELVLRDICPDFLMSPPVNLIRLALHPQGLQQHVVNAAEWREQLLQRLQRQAVNSGRDSLKELYEEVSGYPGPRPEPAAEPWGGVMACLRLRALGTELRMYGTITTLGAATDVRAAELSLESFHPADEDTARVFHEVRCAGPARQAVGAGGHYGLGRGLATG
jgi:transcriptional regulator with XRE-family HTH domain